MPRETGRPLQVPVCRVDPVRSRRRILLRQQGPVALRGPHSTLRVLLVADGGWDVLLMVRELERSARALHWQRVDDASGLQRALAQGAWHIIIADHALLRLSAPAVLAICQAHGAGTPLLVLCGAMPLPQALLTMKAGARDVVFKHELKRLLPVVERELHLRATPSCVAGTSGQDLRFALPHIPGHEHLLSTLALLCKPVVGGRPAALALLHVRGLQPLVQAHGAPCASRVLENVAARMRAVLGDPDYVAHCGDGRFGMILPCCDQAEQALQLLWRLIGAIEAPLSLGTLQLQLRVAVGLCLYPDHGTAPEVLLSHAQAALQAAMQAHMTPALALYAPAPAPAPASAEQAPGAALPH